MSPAALARLAACGPQLREALTRAAAPGGALARVRALAPDRAGGELCPAAFAEAGALLSICALFLASGRGEGPLRTRLAALEDPAARLPGLLAYLAGPSLEPGLAAALDPVEAILGREPGSDLEVVHGLFEGLVAALDREVRGRHGVFVTPAPIVEFLARAVDELLRDELGLAAGLGEPARASGEGAPVPAVTILDPAAGSGALLSGLGRRLHAGGGLQLVGCELQLGAAAVAELVLGQALGPGRARILRANALLDPEALAPGLAVNVVVANPPYRGHSPTRGGYVAEALADYRHGAHHKWLHDDYVKFMRLCQLRIERSGRGVVALVVNHAWLTGPSFAGLRRSLCATFDAIWIVDLHGNAGRRERAPGGGRDENVFAIRQGVALALLVRRGGRAGGLARAGHADLWGTRAGKFATLSSVGLAGLPFAPLQPRAPEYRMTPPPAAPAIVRAWSRLPSLPEIFTGHVSQGVLTAQDELAISFTRAEAEAKVARLVACASEEQARARFRLCTQDDFSFARARVELGDRARVRAALTPILYRPLDWRVTVDDPNVIVPRGGGATSMAAMRRTPGGNLALVTTRQTKDSFAALAARTPCGHKCASRFDIGCVLPLWRAEGAGRATNLDPAFVAALPGGPAPEDVFMYIYALLWSPGYVRRHAGLLREGWPRIPVVGEADRFARLVTLGRRLVELHTFTGEPPTKQPEGPGPGEGRIAPRYPRWRGGCVHLNSQQRLGGVSEAAWQHEIGGFRPARRWLADRRGRSLTRAELDHYRRLVAALEETRALTAELDALAGAELPAG